jgi:hypothetical protein
MDQIPISWLVSILRPIQEIVSIPVEPILLFVFRTNNLFSLVDIWLEWGDVQLKIYIIIYISQKISIFLSYINIFNYRCIFLNN